MAQKSLSKDKTFDWITMSVYFSLLVIGWFMVFSTLYDEKSVRFFGCHDTGRCAISMGSIIHIGVCFSLDSRLEILEYFGFPHLWHYGIFLILVLIFGDVRNGARAWFSFGFFSFQPSEWAKFGTALALSSYLSF